MEYKPSDFKIGVLGGGQLAKMLYQESFSTDLMLSFMDSDPSSPIAKICSQFVIGDITNYEQVVDFGKDKNILTIEIENVNIEALKQLQLLGVKVYPQPEKLEIIKDKGLQKQFLIDHQFPTAPFRLTNSTKEIMELLRKGDIQFPLVQKLRVGGYDGRGVAIIRSESDINLMMEGPSIIEELAPIQKEISVIAIRSIYGEHKAYPAVEMDFHPTANLVDFLICPAEISMEIEERAKNLALALVDQIGIIGLLAIEMFLNKDGTLWINEMAPRPHNSGHHTLNNGAVSQFSNHLRAITGLPLGSTIGNAHSLMLNILGEDGYVGETIYQGIEDVLGLEGVYIYLYGKSMTKPFRKMGHACVTGPDRKHCIEKAKILRKHLKVIS